MRKKRLLLIASAGGHWVQLSRCSPAFDGHEQIYATTFEGVVAPSGSNPVARIYDASKSSPLMLIALSIQLAWLIVIKVRPDVIVSTGAAPGLLATAIGKLCGARTVWIDSLANCERLSLSGRLAGQFSDLWLTQWAHLATGQQSLRYLGNVL